MVSCHAMLVKRRGIPCRSTGKNFNEKDGHYYCNRPGLSCLSERNEQVRKYFCCHLLKPASAVLSFVSYKLLLQVKKQECESVSCV